MHISDANATSALHKSAKVRACGGRRIACRRKAASDADSFKEEANLVAAIGTIIILWAGHAQTNDLPTVGNG